MTKNNQQDAIVKFITALAQTLQADPQQVAQAAQQNPDALKAAVEAFQANGDINAAAQAFTQALQQQKIKAAHGAKLQYVKRLKRICNEDEELVYFKRGGTVDCGCKKKMQNGGTTDRPMNAVDKFRQTKKKIQDKLDQQKEKNHGYFIDPKTGKKVNPKPLTGAAARKRAIESADDYNKGKNYVQGRACGGKMKKKK